MKKIIVIVIALSFLMFINKETIKPTFNEQETEYSMYILEFPNKNVSTNNLGSLFKDIKIIWIQPYINNLYKDRLNYKQYYFEDIALKQNINKFKNNYLNELQKHNYKIEAINYQITGIMIKKMKIYSTKQDIINLNIENIQYQKEDY